MSDFIDRNSIVRTIWGNSDLILLIFAGSAAEFALNRTVDWLFFTGKIPADPVGRLFSTVRYAQEIVFVDEETARCTMDRINAQHAAVERQRGQTIPEWAFRDVLYMLVDYSERAYDLLYEPLSQDQKEDLFSVFRRIGERLHVKELPSTYAEWRVDRVRHLRRDLVYSRHTSLLFRSYRRHLGFWRYYLLREIQALLVPDEVRSLLELDPSRLFSTLAKSYAIVEKCNLRSLVHTLLIPPTYWADVRKFDKFSAATW
jgi:hypothetical protein